MKCQTEKLSSDNIETGIQCRDLSEGRSYEPSHLDLHCEHFLFWFVELKGFQICDKCYITIQMCVLEI